MESCLAERAQYGPGGGAGGAGGGCVWISITLHSHPLRPSPSEWQPRMHLASWEMASRWKHV